MDSTFSTPVSGNPYNGTEFTTVAIPYDATGLWIASMTFTFIVTSFLCYVIIALIFYGYKKQLMMGCGGRSWAPKNRATSVVNSVILLAAFSVFAYVAIEIPLIVPQIEPFCAVYHRVKITAFAFTVTSVYFALWYRVYTAFYVNPILKQNMSKILQVANILTLVFLSLMILSNLVLFFSAPAYATTPSGCTAVQSTENNKVKWAVLVTCTTIFQISLLFSFIYPLHMHRRKMLDRGFDAKSTMPVVKRAAITAGVCVVSDLINSGFAIVYKNPTVYINHIVFSCNLMVNVMGVIFSFATWREKLMPFECAHIHLPKYTARESEANSTSQTGRIHYTNSSALSV